MSDGNNLAIALAKRVIDVLHNEHGMEPGMERRAALSDVMDRLDFLYASTDWEIHEAIAAYFREREET